MDGWVCWYDIKRDNRLLSFIFEEKLGWDQYCDRINDEFEWSGVDQFIEEYCNAGGWVWRYLDSCLPILYICHKSKGCGFVRGRGKLKSSESELAAIN